jgi:hypothetical protein
MLRYLCPHQLVLWFRSTPKFHVRDSLKFNYQVKGTLSLIDSFVPQG